MDLIAESTRLFAIRGTPVYAHRSFIFLVVILLVLGMADGVVPAVSWVLAIFLSLLVHEFGHVFAAKTNGFRAVVVLWWLGGLTIPEGRRHGWRDVWMSFAGPLAGLIFWGVLWFVLVPEAARGRPAIGLEMVFPRAAFDGGPVSGLEYLWADLCFINLFWSVFNLLPIFPMDGGHMTEEILSMGMRRHDAQRAGAIVSIATCVAVGMLVAVTLSAPVLLILLGFMAWQNWNRLQQLN